MKRIIPLLCFVCTLFCNYTYAQCSGCRYIAPVFDSITIETVHFGRGVTIQGDTQELYMDIYQPYGDTATNRPLVMFAFGGGFVQGSKNDWYVEEVCKHYTKAGYVCAAMDYRVGIDYLEILALQHMRIFFRPMQDYRASVQYMKWDYAENGNNYRIDTNLIFAGGASAGAITALMMQHCDKPAEISEMGNISALDALGGFYSTTGFHTNYSWNCAGTINVAGALINAAWIETGDDPIISAHGNADQVVPYALGSFGGLLNGIFDLHGSYMVDSVARQRGVCSYLYTMEGRDHPSESMGLEYFYSIVYRIMLRMEAIRNQQSFCCALNVDITPNDTLFYGPTPTQAVLTANLTGDNGNAQLHWCTMPCQVSGAGNTLTVTADSTLKYVAAMASEGNCLSGDLHIVYDSAFMATAIQQLNADDIALSVYPQPAGGMLHISAGLEQYAGSDGYIAIADAAGRQVYRQPFSATGQLRVTADVSAIPAGSYVLLLNAGNKIAAARQVVITH